MKSAKRGKLIVIEGTDCSGKETQTNLLLSKLKERGIKIEKKFFPNYESPTGRIVGGPHLGKPSILKGFFPEGAANVDPKVGALYYAADRRYNAPELISLLEQGINVLLDRYIYSNMAHQGGKLKNKKDRMAMYKWLETLEYDLLEIPKPDYAFLLHMPYKQALQLKENRIEEPDQHESDANHLIAAEKTYLEIAKLYNFETISCVDGEKIRTIEEINEELLELVQKIIG
jgi:dTMP kinase